MSLDVIMNRSHGCLNFTQMKLYLDGKKILVENSNQVFLMSFLWKNMKRYGIEIREIEATTEAINDEYLRVAFFNIILYLIYLVSYTIFILYI